MKRWVRICLTLAVIVAILIGAAIALFVYQGHREPTGRPDFVALGSSFAAGAGLGALQADSPLLCARSINGYPRLLARKLKLSIVDMTCGGAVTRNLLVGGQFFQGPQIRAIGKQTRLVTLTVGGNDIGLVGDLSLLAARKTDTIFGQLARHLWGGPRKSKDRHYDQLRSELNLVMRAIRHQAPDATIVLATYPAILPPFGTCPQIGLSETEAHSMQAVETQLAETSRAAAENAGAILVDMHRLGIDHNACSKIPWTFGWTNGGKAPFHPTVAGARATAEAIALALEDLPAGVSAVGKHDTARHQAGSVGRKERDD